MEHVQLRDESKDASSKAIDVIKVKAAYTRMVVLQPRERHVVFRQLWGHERRRAQEDSGSLEGSFTPREGQRTGVKSLIRIYQMWDRCQLCVQSHRF